ncbi:MAG: universal stress protein [Actinomycetota bacterium]
MTAWASSVVGLGGEVRTLPDAETPSLPTAIDDVDADLVVVAVPFEPRWSRHATANWVRSVLQQVDRPIAIIGPLVRLSVRGGGTVVAGVGCGPGTDAALPWAARLAEHLGLDLALVGTVPNHPALGPDGLLDVIAFYLDRGVLADWKAEDLERWAGELRAMTSTPIDISQRVERGAPGPGLVRAAVDAAIVVMGRHGFRRDHVALHKPLRHVLDHAEWPVVVVPPEDGE